MKSDWPVGVSQLCTAGALAARLPLLGILDHDVIFPDGAIVHNPLRVLANDAGAEVVFTLFRLPGVDDAEFDRDADLVRADLARLRAHL